MCTENNNAQSNRLAFVQFTEEITKRMRESHRDCRIKEIQTEKNNGICLTGLSIQAPGSEAAPSIYLDGFYAEYLEGATVDEAFRKIDKLYGESRKEIGGLPDIKHFDAVKDSICYRLVNKGRNSRRLNGMPHRGYLDLAIVYYIPLSIGQPNDASIAVTGRHADIWQTDEETLHQYAEANTGRMFPAKILPIEDILAGECPGLECGRGKSGLYLMQNKSCGGAEVMLYKERLREFAGQHGDFYIFPSSISEVLLLPLAGMPVPVCSAEAVKMVRDANAHAVSPEEFLSDNAYLYHADSGETELLE